MTTHTLTRSMLAAMIGAALALGTVASGEARAAQGHAQSQHDQEHGKSKRADDRDERGDHVQSARGKAAIHADVNANERARVSANVEHNQRNGRMLAQAQAEARAQAQRDERNRVQAQADARSRMERAQRDERAQEQARVNARLQAHARANANHDRGDERFRTVPPGQIVSAEAHRRNAERQAEHWQNHRDDRRVAIERERARATQYYAWHAERQRLARQRAFDLQRANRLAQYRYQQQYYDRLRQMQLRDSRYDWNRDPYFNSRPTYGYYRAGNYYQVNNYAADMLRDAVQLGYQQGVRAGQADRYDGWRGNYRDSFAYQDASLGYRGYYVDRNEYEYYFREGFRRGYEDGYNRRSQYGRYDNGNANILGTVLSLILNFRNL